MDLVTEHVVVRTTVFNLWATNHMQLRSQSNLRHSSQLQNGLLLTVTQSQGLLCMKGKYSQSPKGLQQ